MTDSGLGASMDFDSMDFFTNPAFVPDPYPYFEHLRSKGPVVREPHHDVVAVSTCIETLEVYKDAKLFSNCVAVGGPFPPMPFTPEGDDVSDQAEAHRTEMPLHEDMVAMDPPNHTRTRSLLSRLITHVGSRTTRTSCGNTYEPTFVLRGLTDLHLRFTPVR